jgi:hypothetical protein
MHNAPSGTWRRISDRLDEDDILEQMLRTMPLHEAPVVWSEIEDAIPVHSFRHFVWMAKAAAMLIVGFGLWIILDHYYEAEAITVSKEMISTDIAFEQSETSTTVNELIRDASNQTEGVTNNSAIIELMKDLDLLEKEQSELAQEIEKNGNIPELIKARIEVENRKAQTAKNLVRIVML